MESGRLVFSVITAMVIFCLSQANYADAADESSIVHFQTRRDQVELAQAFSTMGFTSLTVHLLSSQDLLVGWKGPLTFFAPTEEAFRNFNSHNSSENHSSEYLLSHHIAKGLFNYSHLQNLPNGTTLDTIASQCSLLVTHNSHRDVRQDVIYSSTRLRASYHPVHVNGVLVSHPDILNDKLITIHGVDKLLPDLQSSSSRCHSNHHAPASSATPAAPAPTPAAPAPAPAPAPTPAAPAPAPAAPAMISPSVSASPVPGRPLYNITPSVLKYAELCLRTRGYSVLALAMRIKSAELLRLQSFTIFTVSDDSFLKSGQEFTNNVRYHVVPNRRLSLADLMRLPAGTRLKTLLDGQSLVVTDSKPFSVNYVSVRIPDVFSNRWIVVHEIPRPLISSADQMQLDSSDSSGILQSLLFGSEI